MGDKTRLASYINSIQDLYVNNAFPWPFYIAEAGRFMRSNDYMMGRVCKRSGYTFITKLGQVRGVDSAPCTPAHRAIAQFKSSAPQRARTHTLRPRLRPA